MTAPRKSDRPSDVELMMFFDGELEPERRRAVEAFLASASVSDDGAAGGPKPRALAGSDVLDATNKLQALDVGSNMVRERALHDASAGDGIADLVMAAVEAEASREGAKRALVAKPVPKGAGAENDNAKRIYLFAGLAVAAAAALLVWGRAPASDTFAPPAPSVAEVREAPAPVKAAAPTAVASAEEESAPGDAVPVHGVEVAAVEFGPQMGTIFYVPAGGEVASATTTVVWLAEDVGDD